MTTITLDEAQSHLRELIEGLTADSELVITQDSRPVARLIAAAPELPQPVFGRGRGKVIVVTEDEEHLNHFKDYMP